MVEAAKEQVREFWEDASCGEELLLKSRDREGFEQQAHERYRLEPFICEFARFEEWRDKKVLEIGVGLGADHQQFVEAGADTTGIDLTERAIELTSLRLSEFNLASNLRVADAESLDFDDGTFDLVYSWGVIHHSPETEQVVSEIYRVLRPGGSARVMIYHKHSVIGFMLWLRYGLFRLRPFRSLDSLYAEFLESPGTKAYTSEEARELFSQFEVQCISTVLTHGDLLTSGAGQRHEGLVLSIARRIWPRWLIRRLFKNSGLFMMIDAVKPTDAS
jgi:ubiquinone/menaquinone biosynthesis C-methylase UbiE